MGYKEDCYFYHDACRDCGPVCSMKNYKQVDKFNEIPNCDNCNFYLNKRKYYNEIQPRLIEIFKILKEDI